MLLVGNSSLTHKGTIMTATVNELFTVDRWTVRELELTQEKTLAVWQMLQRYKTLFSDLTRGKPSEFVQALTNPNNLWFEVIEYDVIIGIIWFSDLSQITDCTAHMVFFDRKPTEKAEVCREMIRWMFNNFPLNRITVTPPAMYHATIRLLKRLGMKYEGCKRQSVLIGGKWNDQHFYGILRSEI